MNSEEKVRLVEEYEKAVNAHNEAVAEMEEAYAYYKEWERRAFDRANEMYEAKRKAGII